MPLSGFRGLLARQAPLHAPRIVEVSTQGLFCEHAQVISIKMPSLPVPPLSSRNYLMGPTCVLRDMTLSQPDQVEQSLDLDRVASDDPWMALTSPARADATALLDASPEIEDLLQSLQAPQTTGKAYSGEIEPKPGAESASPRGFTRRSRGNGAMLPRTDHAPAAATMQTEDVFDLLFPYLLPPIETLLAQSSFFPPGLRPFPFQMDGIRFLAEHESALLGDEMGLGKTIQAIVALRILFYRRLIKKALIVCPVSLLGTWEKEMRKWAPELRVARVHGVERCRLWDVPAMVYLTNYESLRNDMHSRPDLAFKFEIAILDEVQRIKNPESGISKAIRELHLQSRWGLSGTPLENRIEDVFAIFDFIKPGLFKLPCPTGIDEVRDDEQADREAERTESPYSTDVDEVREAIKPFFLRRRLTDVYKELPEKPRHEIWLGLTPAQRRAYDRVEAEAKKALSQPGVNRMHVFGKINLLKQICNLEENTRSSCKLDYLKATLDEIKQNNQKALVFSQFPNKTLTSIKDSLRDFDAEMFDGSLSVPMRERIIEAFQERQTPRVLLMSLKAGGVGLTLTKANHVFHFDHWWNPAVAKQAEARAHRIGQQLPVHVYDIYTENTIEERIYNLLAHKQDLFDRVIDDLSEQSVEGAITDDELFGLFGLRAPKGLASASTDSVSVKASQRGVRQLNDHEFRDLVVRLYSAMDYDVLVFDASDQRRVDMIARRQTDNKSDLLIIRCMHCPDQIVKADEIRQLAFTWQAEYRQATRALLITSGTFSDESLYCADEHQLHLIDLLLLKLMLQKHNVPIC